MHASEPPHGPSLLWPPETRHAQRSAGGSWGERTPADLGLDGIATALSDDRRHSAAVRAILMALCTDRDVIRYRQFVLDDLLNCPALAADQETMVSALAELGRYARPATMQRSLLHQTVWRLGELDLYVDAVERLRAALSPDRCAPHAEAFGHLRARLDAVSADPVFQALAEALPGLRVSLHNIVSITLGVNLDEELRQVEATLLSINAKSFRGRDESLLHRLLSTEDDDYRGIAPLHSVPLKRIGYVSPAVPGLAGSVPTGERENPLLVPLFRDLDAILRHVVQPVAHGLRRFIRVRTSFLTALEPDLVFYLGAVRLIRALQASGLPMCRPEIAPMAEHTCLVHDLFNVNLALRLQAGRAGSDLSTEIVLNDAHFGDDGRIFVLTGPNRGGKTTYLQAVGLAQVLAQAGLHVPGRQARLSPVDGIYSHFPAEEQLQYDLGRLGEEAQRLSAIFGLATPNSLILLNESLSSTSPGESLVLAEDIVRALRLLGARALFATHLHELAANLHRLNAEPPTAVLAASLVAGIEALPPDRGEPEAVRRTYRISLSPPLGHSYARDIARRYGISYEQLRDRLQRRGMADSGADRAQAD